MPVKVEKHLLVANSTGQIPFEKSPNVGRNLTPKYLVIHYTAGASLASSVKSLTDPASKTSAHLVIGRNGDIVQLVPFNRVAWHAGASRWHGLEGMNQFSIGIELDNAGRLTHQGGRWRSWFGAFFPDDEVMEAAHKHGGDVHGWHTFGESQIAAAVDAARAIVDAYGIEDVIGHDDISPGRKVDPGPAFPMESFRAAVMGRREDSPVTFESTTDLNIRSGPGTEFDPIRPMPLPLGTRMVVRARAASWCFVEVIQKETGRPEFSGWVHGDYIRAVAPADRLAANEKP